MKYQQCISSLLFLRVTVFSRIPVSFDILHLLKCSWSSSRHCRLCAKDNTGYIIMYSSNVNGHSTPITQGKKLTLSPAVLLCRLTLKHMEEMEAKNKRSNRGQGILGVRKKQLNICHGCLGVPLGGSFSLSMVIFLNISKKSHSICSYKSLQYCPTLKRIQE